MEDPTEPFAQSLVLLAAAVIAVPLSKRLGLGSVIGYLAAGVAVGPVLRLVAGGEEILHIAELGVVMLLFIIGLELKPSRLWAMKGDILGLGTTQILLCGALVGALGLGAGERLNAAIVIGLGLALSSTAIALQVLEERGETGTGYGRRTFAVLLMQDLAIVPLLALIPVLAPGKVAAGDPLAALEAIGVIALLVVAGLYLLNPMFRLLAAAQAREIMTAAALLVVIGSAAATAWAGLSMGMGAFLAGLLLAESNFRHQLEADIEPFRGILLGLFFLAVGLSLDLDAVIADFWRVLAFAAILVAVKSATIYGIARTFRSPHREAVRMGAVLSQGGEFAFVLFTAAANGGLLARAEVGMLIAVVTLSMAATPLVCTIAQRLAGREEAAEVEENFDGAGGTALVIGFGRFGQVASQLLVAEGIDITVIDSDVEMIEAAGRFGTKVYYGDGRRRDVLIAAGAGRADLICVCVNERASATRIVDLVQAEFPLAKLFVRAYDRGHALDLRARKVDFEIRETFESAMEYGRRALMALGISEERADEVAADVRKRDGERLALQETGGLYAGLDLLNQRTPQPAPLTKPRRPFRVLGPEAPAAIPAQRPDEDRRTI